MGYETNRNDERRKNETGNRHSTEYTEQTIAETDAGAFTWMMSALEFPQYPAEIYGYQSVIGTGNLVASWDPNEQTRELVL